MNWDKETPESKVSYFSKDRNHTDEIGTIFELLEDKYPLILTNTLSLNEGFTIDTSVICGRSAAGKFWLYDDGMQLVFSVESNDKHTHWHPLTISQAMEGVAKFMEEA